MKIRTIVATAAVSLAMMAGPGLAGDAALSRSDGMQLTIKCQNSGCTVRGKQAGGKWGTVEKGPGGVSNFKKLMAKYKGMGFS